MAFRPDINEQDASLKAKELVTALVSASDPEPLQDGKGWACLYLGNLNDERAIGAAWTPPDVTNFARQLSHFSI